MCKMTKISDDDVKRILRGEKTKVDLSPKLGESSNKTKLKHNIRKSVVLLLTIDKCVN